MCVVILDWHYGYQNYERYTIFRGLVGRYHMAYLLVVLPVAAPSLSRSWYGTIESEIRGVLLSQLVPRAQIWIQSLPSGGDL
jgi:hypothetical protein